MLPQKAKTKNKAVFYRRNKLPFSTVCQMRETAEILLCCPRNCSEERFYVDDISKLTVV